MLKRYPHQNPLIYLKDIQYKYLNLIMKFIYIEQCNVEEPDIIQFLLGTIPPKKTGKNSDIMQKGGRGLHPNHYLRTLRKNDKSSMRGGQGYCHFFKFIHSFLGPDIPCVTISLDWGLVRTHSLRLEYKYKYIQT